MLSTLRPLRMRAVMASLLTWVSRAARTGAKWMVAVDQATLAKTPSDTWATRLAHRLSPRYAQCWLLMDRDTEAHDNAEHLYRYLHNRHPGINAWFVVRRGTSDYARLEAQGWSLIAYGSWQHLLALTQCHELISSQIDHYVMSPPWMWWLRRRPWYFTWLQHGVIQSDLSNWLAGKRVRTVVTTSPAEQASLCQPPYTWTSREVVLTGMPRHDALVALAHATEDDQRRFVVFMPTWRNWLLTGSGLSNARQLIPHFAQSPYARNWLGLINSDRLHDAAQRHGLHIVFMPHPNLAPFMEQMDVASGVTCMSYESDVQAVLAQASHVITDYSSNAFDAALIDRPVLYFQFDAHEFLSGRHIGQTGYFDYERDGFDPVVTTVNQAVDALEDMMAQGIHPSAPYTDRISRTFPLRDGLCCQRVTEVIRGHRLELDSEQ